MSTWDTMPWQLRLEEIFTRALPAPDVEKRAPYIRQDDVTLHSPEQNAGVRVRSYNTDGHDYRQEITMAAGEAVGQVLQGSDRELKPSAHVTFADVILKIASTVHLRTDKKNLLWNYTPFNPDMNPTFNMPPGLASAEDAFQFAKASVPGSDTLDQTQQTVNSFSSIGANGYADFTSPFNTYCTLTASKIPMWNWAAISFMQLLFQGATQLWLCGAPGTPLVPAPRLVTLMPLIKQNYTTMFKGGVEGKAIGQTVKEMLKAAVPGLNLMS